jgi:hypothetical protein
MGWKRWLRLFGVVTLILVLYFVVPVEVKPSREGFTRLAGSVLVFGALAFLMVRQLRMHIDDTSRKIDGLVVGIVLVVVVFSHAFYVLNREDPGQFAGLVTRLDSLYFATTTLATVGTGDVHAAGQTARALVLLQMVFNVVFVATTASLVTSRIRTVAETRAAERRSQQEPTGD